MNSPSPLSGSGALPASVRDFLLAFAIPPDMRRAALIRQDEAAQSRVPLARQSWKDSIIMAYPVPQTITVPVAQFQALLEEASLLAARAGSLLEANGVELAPATVLPGNVYDLATARARRQAVSR